MVETENRTVFVSKPGLPWEKKWDFTAEDLSGTTEGRLAWTRSVATYDPPYYIFGIRDKDAHTKFESRRQFVHVVDMTDNTPTSLEQNQEDARGVAAWQGSKYFYSVGFSGAVFAWEWEPGGSLVEHGSIGSVRQNGETEINPSQDLTSESTSRLWHQGWNNETGQHIVATIDITFDSDGVPSSILATEKFYPDSSGGHPLGIAFNHNDGTLYLPEGGAVEVDENGFAKNPKDILVYDQTGVILDRFVGPPTERVYGLHYRPDLDRLWAVGEYVKGDISSRVKDLRLIQRDDHGRRINDTTSTSRQNNKERIRATGTYW